MSIPRDVKEFLENYPDVDDEADLCDNIRFYQNTLRCRPDRKLVEEIHEEWFGNFDKLEYKHGFIQWLFPIREYGMNYQSQPLQLHEIHAIKADPDAIRRVVDSYRLMLDFYGMRLISSETGLVDRVIPPRNHVGRYRNLVRSSHNYLRISRILKCLSELGLERLNYGFLLHVLNEQSEHDELNTQGIRGSMDRWWANCIRDDEQRDTIGKLIRKVRNPDNDYVFTREEYQAKLGASQETDVEESQGGVSEATD
ncbi:hypothetical protein FA15DRAFT_635399 [Coprinopsis marcescibilis]|uniref:Opioid growth factor receptor (OGFr) conserved domain-containing protein n=1 Tax=Coprinopsis marcescibilis TaxID=230819 RepID=A0A5C3L4W5_COPMA|nr:hypothetical protein FA15DRAFT_635399 [Coprinopsis marcescibilis]